MSALLAVQQPTPSPDAPLRRVRRRVEGAERDETSFVADVFAPDAADALGSRFQLVRELGRGGMGVVVLARDVGLQRVVALKLQHPILAACPRARERFRREARIQAQLDHPGIVAVHASGEASVRGRPVPWFAMAYVPGESLGERLQRERTLPSATVRRLLLALLDALTHAHGEGVVHRDLKPENVLLARDGRVLLTDFGVAARPSHDDPRRNAADVGTPLWMAPEQFAGEHAIDGRTDLYALGALGFAMLAGRPPFAGPSARAVAVAHLMGDAPALATLVPRAPRAMVAALQRCLAKDPTDRWPDAAALRAALADGALAPLLAPLRRLRAARSRARVQRGAEL
ncbi:MAG: serine/threonine-protein kinase [Gemmatirosa sp.]